MRFPFEKLVYGSETWHKALTNKNMRILHPYKNGDSPSPLHYPIFEWTKGGIFKSCPRVLDCVWSLDLSLNMLRLDWQNCIGVGGDHDQIGSGRDINEVGY